MVGVAQEQSTFRRAGDALDYSSFNVLITAGAGMGYYFWKVTGNPVTMPYQVNQATYSMTNPFFGNRYARNRSIAMPR